MTGYSRDQFGPAWADVDRNGCDTRNDILARDLTQTTFKAGTHNCVVLSGTFVEPYSGHHVSFQRGRNTSILIQIDHVVALGDAWVTGAQQWTPAKRLSYANDPLVLLAVDGPLNEQKEASDAASWLPPNKSYRCDYVARQVSVKAKYGLWVTPAEKAAMVRVLSSCPDQQVLSSGKAAVPATARTGSIVTLAKHPTTTVTSGSGTDYGTCANAKAHGGGPYRRGVDPEYRFYRDADGDGVTCE